MNTLSALPHSPAIDCAWSEAVGRVEAYLRVHRLTDENEIARVTAEIIGRARLHQQPNEAPVVVAMEISQGYLRGEAAQVEVLRPLGELCRLRSPEICLRHMVPEPQPAPVPGGWWQWIARWGVVRTVVGLLVVLSVVGATIAAGF